MFYKLIDKTLTNRRYPFKPGLNELINEPFDPQHECAGGGFYFCNIRDLAHWLYLYPDGLIFEVLLPDDAIYVSMHLKFKANKIIISNPMNISDFIKKHNLAKSYVESNISNIRFIDSSNDNYYDHVVSLAIKLNPRIHGSILPEHKSVDILRMCVKRDGNALLLVHDQTPEICLIAVKQNGNALAHVKSQTPEICLIAVKQNGNALAHVKSQTPEICMCAVKQNGFALCFVKIQTPELCLAAVKQNPYAISCIGIDILTRPSWVTFGREIISAAVQQNDLLIDYVDSLNINI
jgi:hypothetical protein